MTKGNPQKYAHSTTILIELTQKHIILQFSNYIFQFTTAIAKTYSLWRQLETPRIPEIVLKFPNFLKSYVLSLKNLKHRVRQLIHLDSSDNNQVPFPS